RPLHPFPTRRSSDLLYAEMEVQGVIQIFGLNSHKHFCGNTLIFIPGTEPLKQVCEYLLTQTLSDVKPCVKGDGSVNNVAEAEVRSEEHTSELQSREN